MRQSGKQDPFRHIDWRVQLVCMKVQTQFFSTTSGIQSGPGAFDKSRVIVALLTISGVTKIFLEFQISSRSESK